MAIVKTDRAHYEGIADALRSLHDGEETYTPAQMGEYLATQGRSLKPENIAEGITIFGVTGTMRYPMYDEWPEDIPPESDFDDAVSELDPEAPGMDKMLLMDDKGNITVGYLYNTAVTGRYSYNGLVLKAAPAAWDKSAYPNAYIAVNRGASGEITKVYFVCSSKPCSYQMSTGDIHGCRGATDTFSQIQYSYSGSDGEWSSGYETTGFLRAAGNTSLVWANHDMYEFDSFNSIYDADYVYLAGSEAVPAGFGITAYNYKTTDFRAIGWIRVSYHTTGEYKGQFTIDDFRTAESGGWNYIQNVRWSTRAKLSYMGTEIWPQGPQMYVYNGHTLPAMDAPEQSEYSFMVLIKQSSYVGAPYYTVYTTSVPLIKRKNYMQLKAASPVYADGTSPSYMRSFASGVGAPVDVDYQMATFTNISYSEIVWANYDIAIESSEEYAMRPYTPTSVRRPDPVI